MLNLKRPWNCLKVVGNGAIRRSLNVVSNDTVYMTSSLHHTWHHSANQHHPALIGPICDPPRLANSTFLARRLTIGREVSLSMDQLSGTAYLLNFGHLTSRWMFSKPNWRHFCLAADLAHLVYLFWSCALQMSLIIVIIIIKKNKNKNKNKKKKGKRTFLTFTRILYMSVVTGGWSQSQAGITVLMTNPTTVART